MVPVVPGTLLPPTIDIEDGVNSPDLSAARSRRWECRVAPETPGFSTGQTSANPAQVTARSSSAGTQAFMSPTTSEVEQSAVWP